MTYKSQQFLLSLFNQSEAISLSLSNTAMELLANYGQAH